jgi:hypothetical protein
MESKGKISFGDNTRRRAAGGTIRTFQGALGCLSEQEVLFGGLKSLNTMPRGKLGSYPYFPFQHYIISLAYLLSLNCIISYTSFQH